MDSAPHVSIGLPTHNGERFIADALSSLLAQDYSNFEILISENGSSDGTLAIAQAYAARDARIRVIRQPVNIGAPANFNFVFRESSGPLFMWAADDDWWEPGYVSACVRALQSAPAAVLACTQLTFMNEDGDPIAVDRSIYDNPDLRSPSIERRIRILLSRGGWYQIYGLMRRDVLARTRLGTNAFGADVVLLVELALQGPFVLVPEKLFHYRHFEMRMESDRGAWHHSITNRKRVTAAPYTFLQEAIGEAISVSPLRPMDKARAWLGMVAATYVTPTPIRSLIIGEARVRLRMAIRDLDPVGVVKYASLCAAVALYRRSKRLLRAT